MKHLVLMPVSGIRAMELLKFTNMAPANLYDLVSRLQGASMGAYWLYAPIDATKGLDSILDQINSM